MPETHTLCKQVILSRIFKHMVPVDYYQSKRSIMNLFFYLSSNSFASFLSQTSNLVHCTLHYLHLLTQVYQPPPVSALSVSCQLS